MNKRLSKLAWSLSAIAFVSTLAALSPAAAAIAGASQSTTTTNPLACSYHAVAMTATTVFNFTQSTDTAFIDYVGKGCLTLTIAGAPDNPNPTARSIASVIDIELDQQTSCWIGSRKATISAARVGDQLLSLTEGGKYPPFRAVKIVVLPEGAKLPE